MPDFNQEHHDINDIYHRLVDIKNNQGAIAAVLEDIARSQEKQLTIFRQMLEHLQAIDAKTPDRPDITADKGTVTVTQKG